MVRTNSGLITHAYRQSSTPGENSKECFEIPHEQSSVPNKYCADVFHNGIHNTFLSAFF